MPRNRVSYAENQPLKHNKTFRKVSNLVVTKPQVEIRQREPFKDLQNVNETDSPIPRYNTRYSRCSIASQMVIYEDPHCQPIPKESDPYTAAKSDQILSYIRSLEESSVIRTDFLIEQPNVDDKKRTVLIDWLVHVNLKFGFTQDTLFISVQLLNNYLATKLVEGSRFQLIGATCLLLAAKYEEVLLPELQDFAFLIDYAYSVEDIKETECEIISVIDGDFSPPTISLFINRFCVDCEILIRSKYLADYFSELCLLEYTLARYYPSLIASACILLAIGVNNELLYIQRLESITNYTKRDLVPIMRKIVYIIRKNEAKELTSSFNKYSHSSYASVSTHWRLNSKDFFDLKLF